MRRLVHSAAYLRVRVVTGCLFIVLGAAIVLRTVLSLGIDPRDIAPVVLGFALMGLGTLRVRDYARARRSGT